MHSIGGILECIPAFNLEEIMKKYVGGKIFENIEVDDRITPDLDKCIYCYVASHNLDKSVTKLDYKIPLNCIHGSMIKQCPACKRIYVLKDILEEDF